MTLDAALLSIHAFATLALVGLIWTIQVVHYPLFARVPAGSFTAYEQEHMRRITWLVGPLMLVEAALAVWLVFDRPAGVPTWAAFTALGLLVLIWLSTALVQTPMHVRLSKSYDTKNIRALVLSNWPRTFMWTVRGVLALVMLNTASHAPTLESLVGT